MLTVAAEPFTQVAAPPSQCVYCASTSQLSHCRYPLDVILPMRTVTYCGRPVCPKHAADVGGSVYCRAHTLLFSRQSALEQNDQRDKSKPPAGETGED